MRIAVLADIHGNLPALEAVMLELEQLQPDMVVVNGDLINGVPFTNAVLDRIIDAVRKDDWIIIRGNHEFYYLDFGTERAEPSSSDPNRWGGLHKVVREMRPEHGAYLATLPDERTFYLPNTEPIRFAHGVPGNNRTGFHADQLEGKIAEKIVHVAESTFVSAHTHVQIDRQIRHAMGTDDERSCHLINSGSIGIPLNGNPAAQFAVLESVSATVEPGGWQCTHYSIPYDHRPVLEEYLHSGALEVGGVIGQLFYWELVTAMPEIILFHRWAYEQGLQPNDDLNGTFQTYIADTGREQYIRENDPLGPSSLASFASKRIFSTTTESQISVQPSARNG